MIDETDASLSQPKLKSLLARDRVSVSYVFGFFFLGGCALFCVMGGLLSNPPRLDVARGGGTIFGLLALLSGVGGVQRLRWIRNMVRRAIKVEGVVVRSYDDGLDETWHLAVEYDFAGRRMTYDRSLNLTRRTLVPGDRVRLLVDPDRPGFVWLSDDAKIESRAEV